MPRKLLAPLVAGCVLILLAVLAAPAGSGQGSAVESLECASTAPISDGGVTDQSGACTYWPMTDDCFGNPRDCSCVSYY